MRKISQKEEMRRKWSKRRQQQPPAKRDDTVAGRERKDPEKKIEGRRVDAKKPISERV